MKTKIKLSFSLLVIIQFLPHFIFAQGWNQTPNSGFKFVQTNAVGPNNANWIKSVGVGDFTGLGSGAQPLAALDVNANYLFQSTGFLPGEVFRTDAPAGLTAWRMFSANVAANEKFNITNPAGSNNVNLSAVQNGSLNFFTNTTGTRKMRISHSNPFHPLGANLTRTSIGTADFPLSYLHIGLDALNPPNPNVNKIGFRTWMDKGVIIVGGSVPFAPNLGSDNAYFGLKEVNIDRTDAVINWGNNPFSDPLNHGDRLLFVFTADPSFGFNASTPDGLEASRIISDGNISMTGIGGDPTVNPYSFPFVGPPAGSDPGNTLEINSPVVNATSTAPAVIQNNTFGWQAPNPNPAYAPATGISGLRFTDLTSQSAPVPTGATGTTTNVLSVDNNGDVIMVPGGTGGANVCGGIQTNFVTKWTGTDLCNSQFIDDGVNTGVSALFSPAKFHVPITVTPASPLSIAGFFSVGGIGDPATVYTGVYGTANVPGSIQSYGVQGWGSGGVQNYGVYGTTSGSANFNFGGFCESSGGTSANYGIYGRAAILGNNRAGYFDGDIQVTGTINPPSDQILKENIQDINNATELLTQLQPKTFNFKTNDFPSMNLPSGTRYGLIAQELETVLPELVSNTTHPEKLDSLGNVIVPAVNYKSANYDALIPLLVKGFKEQQVRIIALEGGGSKTNENGQTEIEKIKLTLPDAPVLGDARPNPNSGYAEIAYYLPESSLSLGGGTEGGVAKIIFIDMLGRTMQEKTIQTGYGIIGIDTKDLPSGNYYYSLIINGNKIETKTMVKTK